MGVCLGMTKVRTDKIFLTQGGSQSNKKQKLLHTFMLAETS